MKNRKNKKKKGFTLIELVIVLAVMAIIALIAIPNFTAIRDNSKDKADASSLDVVERNILMLVSDGTLTTHTTDNVFKATFATAGAKADVTSHKGSLTDDEVSKVNEALKNVTQPQGHVQGAKDANGKRPIPTSKAKAKAIKVTVKPNGDVIAETVAA